MRGHGVVIGLVALTLIVGAVPAAGRSTSHEARLDDPAYDGPHLVYLTVDGHVHVLTVPGAAYQTVPMRAITDQDVTVSAKTSSRAVGTPSAWVSQNDVPEEHIVYRSKDGHVHELWRHIDSGHWIHTDLTAAAKAKVHAMGNVAGWGDGVRRVVYRGSDGHLHELTWSSATKKWRDYDLTKITHATVKDAGEPFYRGGWVVYRSSDGHIHLLTPGNWKDLDVWKLAKSKVKVLGNPTVWYSANPSPSPAAWHVLFRGADHHLHELWGVVSTGKWLDNDLTNQVGLAANVTNDPTGWPIWFGDYDPGLMIHYLDAKGTVWEITKHTGNDDPMYGPFSATPWKGGATDRVKVRFLDLTPLNDSSHVDDAWVGIDGHVHIRYLDPTYTDDYAYDATLEAGAPLAVTGVAAYYTPDCTCATPL